jgi:hypothetical protein
MTKKLFIIALPVCVLIALLAAFLFVSPAFAQDEVPPEVAPTEVATEVAPAEVTPTEVAPVEALLTEVAPTEVLPTEVATTKVLPTEITPAEALSTEAVPVEGLSTEAAPVEEPLAEASPVEELSAAKPSLAEQMDIAGVVFSYPDGTVISMAEKDAQEKINNADPWFFVGLVEHDFVLTTATCTPSATLVCHFSDNPIQNAIDAVKYDGLIPNTGGIYVMPQASPYEEDIIIDGVIGLKALWGSIAVPTGEPLPIIKGSITITNMPLGFELGGFVIQGTAGALDHPQGAIDISYSAGSIKLSNLEVTNSNPLGQGIAIGENPADNYLTTHTRSVEFTSVDCSNNTGGGALITANGAITIKNSSFERNTGDKYVSGLSIDTKGAVLLDGVSVNSNGLTDSASAAFINNSGALSIKNSIFNGNPSIWGLANNSITGTVTLDNVYANENRAGIWLGSKGNLVANNVHAISNYRNGAVFDTCWDSSTDPYDDLFDQTCTSPSVGNITVTNSEFNGNSSNYAGLSAWAKGAITLTNIDASNNRGIDDLLNPTYTTAGARLQNYGNAAVYPVTVNSSTFNGNSDDGIEIFTKGLVTINKVSAGNNGVGTAESNHSSGVYIDNTWGTAGVTFNGTTWGDNSEIGNAYGVVLWTNGNLLLNYLSASGNAYTNSYMDTSYGIGNVTINKSTFDDSTNNEGLVVYSNGTVTLNAVNASGNYSNGAYIDNSTGALPKAVVITSSTFNDNQDDGLVVLTHGAITLTNTSAKGNYDNNEGDTYYIGRGAWLENDFTDVFGKQYGQPISITGGNFDGNRRDGLEIYSYGILTVKNATANGNSEWGAYLTNFDATLPKAITISGSSFNGNQSIGGLYAHSRGAVTLTNISVSENSHNSGTITSGDTFSEVVGPNYGDSWFFDGISGDTINFGLNYKNYHSWPYLFIELYDEDGNLVYDSGDKPVNSDYYGDSAYDQAIVGYQLVNSGTYHLQISNYNGSYSSGSYTAEFWEGTGSWGGTWTDISDEVLGAAIDNTGGAGVTITNPVDSWNYNFNYNNGFGLDIITKGAVKITNATVSYNASFGSDIYNQVNGSTAGVTLTGSGFDGNDDYGFYIWSNGPVLLTNTIANENIDNGGYIDNKPSSGSGAPLVTITNDPLKINWWHAEFSGNGGSGFQITSYGVISLSNVSANDNGVSGASLNNYDGSTDIKIINSIFNGNGNYGLSTLTKGNISFVKGSASSNGAKGASLETYPASLIKNITVTDVTLNNNNGTGLYVRNNGAITLTNLQTNYNYGDNGVDDYAKGADLNNCRGDCTLPTTTGNIIIKNSNFNGNNDTGLLIDTYGNVTLTSVYSNDNVLYGAYIGDLGLANNVAISGMSTFYRNGDSGLEVYAKGNIILTNVDSAQNGSKGAYLNNTYGTLPAPVSLLCTLPYWTNWFGENAGNGLEIITNGAVVVNKIDASNNTSGDGVYISNETAPTPANVTINTGWMNNNNGTGLRIRSTGVVLVNVIEADNNGVMGAWINNEFSGDTQPKPVTVTKSIFKVNINRGLFVQSYGNITVNNITASGNLDFAGIELNNQVPYAIGTVTVLNTLGDNYINNNQDYGLKILSNKAVSVTGVSANGNLGYGLWIDNYSGTTGSGNITINKVTTRDNDFTGLRAESNGVVTISSLVSMFNGEFTDLAISTTEVEAGVTILTHSSDTVHKTTISSSVVMGNYKDGIQIFDFSGYFPWWWHPVITSVYFGNNTLSPYTYHNIVVTDTL